MVAGPTRPIFTEFGGHGDGWDVRATPGSDVAHDAPRRRGVVGRAVRIRAKPLACNSGGIQPEKPEIGGLVGGVVAARDIRVQHRDHFWLLEVTTKVGS